MSRYRIDTVEFAQERLAELDGDIEVRVEPSLPIVAKNVAELRKVPSELIGLILDIRNDTDPLFSTVRVERP